MSSSRPPSHRPDGGRRAPAAGSAPAAARKASPPPPPAWTFLTNHGHVLVCLARDAQPRLRDIAVAVGITERSVQGIIADLEAAGIVRRERDGRRNRYSLSLDVPLRHPLEAHHTVAQLLRGVS